MAHQHSHVPKFGNWDSDNVPYTAYFENARRERSGSMVNPNDPEQNPEAFNLCMGESGHNKIDTDDSVKGFSGGFSQNHNPSISERGRHGRHHWNQRSRGSHGSFTGAESVSERSSNSDHSVLHRRGISDNKKSVSRGGSSVSSSSSSSHHQRRRSGSHSSNEYSNQKATPIPKFGAWDEKDPKSGEGFTLIFNKVKEEKQIESHHFPDASSPLANCSNMKNHRNQPSSALSRYCCCLFSSESK